MKRKKVCILTNGLARGGTDTFVVNLSKNLDRKQYDLTIVNSCLNQDKLQREQEVLDAGIPILHTADLTTFGGKMSHLLKLYRILRKGKFDVFQTNIDLFNGPNLFVAWLARVPIRVCHSHNTRQLREMLHRGSFIVGLYQKLMKWLCWKFANRYCGCSEQAMDFLFPGRPWRQSEYPSIINNGIDIEMFQRPIDINEKKKELGLTAKKNIVTVGNFTEQKNPLFIAECMLRFLKERNDVDFVWVGKGPLKDMVEKNIESQGMLGRFHFLGSRSDISEILKCCDLFFFPSSFEGLGIALIEAQAAGLPCVASSEVPKLADCGATRFIPLDESIDYWVEEITKLLDAPTILKADRQRLNEFSITNMVRLMERVFTCNK